MNIVSELTQRDLVKQQTNHLEEHLNESRVVYCGFDPTADSLHIGSLVPLITMKRFQDAGHKPVLLVGGATGLIGDPSFKTQERSMNTYNTVSEWTDNIKSQVSQFLDFDDENTGAVVANNFDWFKDISVIDFLRDTGKHFSVNAMIQKESVKQRIERDGEGISFTEFAYMLMQSQDFAELNKSMNCTVQIGGSDQWGNIVGGIDLTRRQNGEHVFGMTMPLVTKADGTKFGKTESGTVWLDPKKTTPYQFFQFWLNTSDEDVYQFLKFFTFLSPDEIQAIEEADKERTKPEAQKILAREVTKIVHGKHEMLAAEMVSNAFFNGDFSNFTDENFEILIAEGMPHSKLTDDVSIVEALVDVSQVSKSRKMAREHIKNNAVKINGVVCDDVNHVLTKDIQVGTTYNVVRVGKKKYHLFVFS